MTTPKQPEVLCLDCKTPVTAPTSRARRIGEGCWRKRRAAARAQRVPVALPGFDRRAAAQTGPGLLDDVRPAAGEEASPAGTHTPCEDCPSPTLCAPAQACGRAAR